MNDLEFDPATKVSLPSQPPATRDHPEADALAEAFITGVMGTVCTHASTTDEFQGPRRVRMAIGRIVRCVLDLRQFIKFLRNPPQTAKLFVGLNVGAEPRWTTDDVLKIVAEVQCEQSGKAGAFLGQGRSVWTCARGALIDESSIPIEIIDVCARPWAVFTRDMFDLAETLAGRLQQESVLLSLYKGGLHIRQESIQPLN